MFTSKHQLVCVTQKAALIQTFEVLVSHLWRKSISYSRVDGIGWSSRAHKAVWITWEGVASRREAVSRGSFSLTSTSRGLVAGGGGQRLGTVHCAGWLRHCSKEKTDVIIPQPDGLKPVGQHLKRRTSDSNQQHCWHYWGAHLGPKDIKEKKDRDQPQPVYSTGRLQTLESAAAPAAFHICFCGRLGTSITLAPFCPGDIFYSQINIWFNILKSFKLHYFFYFFGQVSKKKKVKDFYYKLEATKQEIIYIFFLDFLKLLRNLVATS